MAPWFWLIAGPNGAGKSTLAADRYSNLVNVNADEIARELRPDHPGSVSLPAGRRTLAAIDEIFAKNISFTVETTLSGKLHMNMARRARRLGWRVGLAYICVENPDDAILRVQERYRRGGHNVRPEDVRRRYERSLQNLSAAIQLSHISILYDNSTTSGYLRVLEVRSGDVVYAVEGLPKWTLMALGALKL